MHELDEILSAASANVAERYFKLPIYGGGDIYRERVYCYELYHQMRNIWPEECQYVLNGEIDKRAHPVLSGHGAGRKIPDFLVHVPGEMNNFAIVEVKHSLDPDGVGKDLETLNLFIRSVGYHRAIYLIYGDEADATAFEKIERIARGRFESISRIEIWLHSEPQRPACFVGTLSF